MPNAILLRDQIPADPTGWWISEKFDGIRAIWTGTRLLTRSGKALNPPAWWTDGMPDRRLDGELWAGHGKFDQLVSRIQKGEWSEINYMVFDIAESGGFEDRNRYLYGMTMPAHCRVVPHIKCKGAEHLDRLERNVVSIGGEGLVIRRPGHKYAPGRSGDVVKVKRLVSDVDRWQG